MCPLVPVPLARAPLQTWMKTKKEALNEGQSVIHNIQITILNLTAYTHQERHNKVMQNSKCFFFVFFNQADTHEVFAYLNESEMHMDNLKLSNGNKSLWLHDEFK